MLKSATGISVLLSLLGIGGATPSETNKASRSEYSVTIILPGPKPVSSVAQKTRIDLTALRGMKLGNLNAWYVGIGGKAPETLVINFAENLDKLWERKLDRGVTPATKKSFQRVVDRYTHNDPGLTTLPQFVTKVDDEVKLVHQNLDYTALCQNWDKRVRTAVSIKKHYLHAGGCALLKDMAGQITGRDLVAYGMTELFPARDGEKNIRLLQVLLPNAGSEYLNALPALGDPLLSLGFYQFTSHAVRHDASGAHGASMVSEYAQKDMRIPGSVIALNGNDHHRAAFYFAVYNIANWIRHSTPQEKRALRILFPSNMDNVAQYMAVAHHLPGPASKRARAWVQGGGKKPLVSYLGPKLTIYANKTKTNRAALDTFLGDPS
jgi:hypothetical protein